MQEICLVIRIGNFGIDNAIQAHKAIISKKGYCWGGWWAQANEFLPPNLTLMNNLNFFSRKKGITIFFLNNEEKQLYSVRVTELEYSPDHSKIYTPEKECTPEYYNNSLLWLWFKMESISNPLDDTELKNYSYCDYTDECKTDTIHDFSAFNDTILSGIEQLSVQDRSLFFIRKSKDTDKINIVAPKFIKASNENIATSYKQTRGNSILLLSDIHFSDVSGKHAFKHTESKNNFEKKTLFESINEVIKNKFGEKKFEDISAAIIAGDLTYCGTKTEFSEMKEFIIGLYNQYAMDMEQIIIVPGNHDINFSNKDEIAKIDYSNLKSKKNYIDLYKELYKIPPNDYLAVGKKIMLGNQLPIDIVGLNSNCLQQVEKRFQGMGFVGNEQIKLIERGMGWSENSYSFKILVLHHNIHPVEYIEKPEFDYAYSTCLDAGLITSFITRNKINLVIHGHKHQEQFLEVGCKTKNCKENELFHYNVLSLGSAGTTELAPGVVNSIAVLDFNEYNIVELKVLQISSGNNDNPRELFVQKIKIF